jgi:hypothetical protein
MTSAPRATQVRIAVALAHSIPGVRLQVTLRDGSTVLVGAGCLGALTPCQFRAAIVDRDRGQVLLEAIESVAVSGGLADLGGGLYERGGANGDQTERWFASTLAPDAIADALTGSIAGIPDDAFETVLRPDPELGAGTVCLRAIHPALDHRLDDVAHWALSRCLVAELLAGVALASLDPER